MLGIIDFDRGIPLSTINTGCGISLWNDNVNLYGCYDFGINSSQMIYNVVSNASHAFQVSGSSVATIN